MLASRVAAKPVLVLLPTALLIVLGVSAADLATAQRLFVNTTYYCLWLLVLCWLGLYLDAARKLDRERVVAWLRQNWPGLAVALLVTAATAYAVQPGLRMLSDEANLVGVSKNLYASKTATFTVSGKNYYDSYWDVDVAIDRRPTLLPFLVSLLHAVLGYSYRNAFHFNLLVLPAFLLLAYRLAKSLAGEVFGIVAALCVAAHPVTLLAVRSGGFDFVTCFFALLVLKTARDCLSRASPANLALLWLNLCMFTEVRYETALFVPLVIGLLWLFQRPARAALAPYALLYAASPVFLAPRIWQALLRGNVPEQEPGATTFSLHNFVSNAREYFEPLWSPRQDYPAHSAPLIGLGVVGCVLVARQCLRRVRARDGSPELKFAALLAAWMLLQIVISFTYVWGRAQYPSSARLLIALDTFFSFTGAWALTLGLGRLAAFVPVLPAAALVLGALPIASQHRMLNRLTQTRESRATWEFFERLGEKRILIVTDRPNHFTIMNYGAMSFDSARRDPYLLTALERRLFYDVYVIQQIQLSTGEPLPAYAIWPERELVPVLEFQNDADVLVRVSRVAH